MEKKFNYPALVLDCSVTMAWIFEQENTIETETIKKMLFKIPAKVPTIWPLEVSNVLYLALKKKRLYPSEVTEFIFLLQQLPIIIDTNTNMRVFSNIINLAEEQDITVYNASYLDLAMIEGLPLATLDSDLKKAAMRVGVEVLL